MVSASRRNFAFVLALTLAALTPIAEAQKGRRTGPVVGGTRGTSPTQLNIQITGENSQHLNMQLNVELVTSSSRQMNNTTFTDTNGRVQFAVPGPGTYQVKVSGPNIEDTTSGTISIEPGEMIRQEYISVKVRNNGANASAPGKEATISAAELNIPEKARKEYSKGVEEMRKKDFKKAREHFTKATRQYEKFDLAYNALGVICMAQGDKVAAREAFAKALAIDERNAAAERNLARILIGEREFATAEKHALHSLIAQPQDADALILTGFAQLQQGKLDDAVASARRVHSGEKHAFPVAHLIAARALEAKKMTNEAAAEYRTYLAEAPNAPEATIAREGLQRTAAK